MKTALWMGKMMHEHLTKLWMNAWSYWNLTAVGEDYADDASRKNPALIQDGVKFKRGYVLGNYAKFVRPGFTRVEATASPAIRSLRLGVQEPERRQDRGRGDQRQQRRGQPRSSSSPARSQAPCSPSRPGSRPTPSPSPRRPR